MYIEKGINSLGKFISLMIPVMTILMIVIIVARYFFGIGLTGLQEFVMYLHAFIFLGCAGYVHYKDEHVRVDIFYRGSSNAYKNNVNFILSLFFLLPVCFVIGFYSIEFCAPYLLELMVNKGASSRFLLCPFFLSRGLRECLSNYSPR